MDETVIPNNCSTETKDRKAISILTLAEMAGMSTGIVSTTSVTNASPACCYANSVNRRWESDVDKKERARDGASECNDIGKLVQFNRLANCAESLFTIHRTRFHSCYGKVKRRCERFTLKNYFTFKYLQSVTLFCVAFGVSTFLIIRWHAAIYWSGGSLFEAYFLRESFSRVLKCWAYSKIRNLQIIGDF